jgi:type IV pilus assembly protein PilW
MNTLAHYKRAFIAGVSLIELLVAMVIGLVLIFGATQVYVDSRKTYEINEAAARLQETARYAMSILEPDIRLSNYWGLVKGASLVINQASQTIASVGPPTQCGQNFARDLIRNVQGSNHSYLMQGSCAAYGAGAVATADTLVIRRAASTQTVSTAGRLQICSTRVAARLFSDGSACTAPPDGRVNDLIVNAYYVSKDAVQVAGLPTLRRWALAGTDMQSEEIAPGIEDFQVQFGIDDPAGSLGSPTLGAVVEYINPGEPMPAEAQVVAVRIWLLVRSENEEQGFTDDRTYEYADRSEANGGVTSDLNDAASATFAYKPGDKYRRLLVSRTIFLRNALGT